MKLRNLIAVLAPTVALMVYVGTKLLAAMQAAV